MKKLVCEMCGSTDLLKKDDRYICEACGTAYTTEEAKKLFIELSGKVDVSGSTVKVDHTSFVQKSLENARRAKAKEDWEECEKYYNMVEQHDPQNIEAIFYSAYGKTKMGMVDPERFKRKQKVNVLKNSISIIDDNYDASPEEYNNNKILITQMHESLMTLVKGSFVYTRSSSGYNDSGYTYTMFNELCLGWIETLENIIKKIEAKSKNSKDIVYLLKFIRESYVYVYDHVIKKFTASYKCKIKDTDERIMRIDPNYQPPYLKERTTGLSHGLKIFIWIVIIYMILTILMVCAANAGHK